MEIVNSKLSKWDKWIPYYKKYMFLVGIFGQLLFYMQAVKIFLDRSAKDVSLFGFLIGLVSVSSWLLYGVIIKDKVLIVANVFAVIGAFLTVLGILIYGC